MVGIIWFIGIISQFDLVFMLCENRNTCQKCIADISVCAWCGADDFSGTSRCAPANSIPNNWCSEPTQNPKGKAYVPLADDRDFSSDIDNFVQIKPQSYNIKLRPGEAVPFKFSFKASRNYPVDLYFLMDASLTMNRYKKRTAEQSEQIYETFRKMTDNVYLGLGTFVDKNVLPFSSVINGNDTYSFWHRLKLNEDADKFKYEVSNTPNGTNRDSPEGGFDALAQAIACNEIGWRKESTKIVVFLTDAPSHVAGDGKAAGIFEPYDGKCYMENNVYSKEKELDYPSPGRINQMAVKNDVIIIFAVTYDMYDIYSKLSTVITGSKTANIQQTSADGIVTILRNIYEKITNNIKLKVNYETGLQKMFDISVNPDCLYSDVDCKSRPDQEKSFEGTIRLKEAIAVNKTIIEIMVDGITQKLALNIDIIKECECQKDMVGNSSYCSGMGTRLCGICQCDSSRDGLQCECAKDKTNPTNDNSACMDPESHLECAGHGTCICGQCKCNERFECKYCQIPSKTCNGNGHSECGICSCNDGFSGDNCECSKADDKCIHKGKKCNNRGDCNCNKCKCYNLGGWDKRYDEIDEFCNPIPCASCEERQCAALEPCALCKLEKNDCPSDICYPDMVVELTDTLAIENASSWTKCNDVRVSAGCYTPFLYKYNSESYGISVMVQKDINCAENYLWYGGALLVTLLLGGIGALVGWKVVTNMRDRREFQDFLRKNKTDLSEITDNPLFISPQVQVNNPGFRKRSFR